MKKVLWACMLSVIFCGWGVQATMNENDTGIYKEVVIEERDTLWSIADREIGNDVDIRRYVYDMQHLNGITHPGALIPGQTLKLPYPKY